MSIRAGLRGLGKGSLSPRNTFAGIVLFACLAVVALALVSLVRSRAQYRRRAEITAQNLCTALADTLLLSYEKIDLALLSVKDELERQQALGAVDGPSLEAFIKRQHSRIPDLATLRTADADGLVTFGNEESPTSRISVADRDYFLRLKSDPGAGLVFSKPVMGRVRVTRVILLARRINRPDGSFGGVVYSAIILDELGARFASYSMGREGAIALRNPELAVIARHGGSRDVTGQTMVSPEFRALLQAGHTSGTYEAVTVVDRVARIYAFRQLQPYGQWLHVGLGTHEVFEPWRREALQTLGFVALFLLLILASAGMALRAWQRRERAEAEREHVILELQGALAEVKALSGLLPICSNCKKIRDDHGYWNQIESYISSHSDAQFTHGICPDCARLLFPEIFRKGERTPEGSAPVQRGG
jgi:hypothetical protein